MADTSSHTVPVIDDTTRAQLLALGTSTVHEAQGQTGQLPTELRPLWPEAQLVGTAIPVRVGPGDNLALHQVIALASPGDVIVASCGDYHHAGVWGEILTVAAMERGIAGLVVDGSVRDIRQIEQLGFPIFCRGVSMRGTTKKDPADLSRLTLGGVDVSRGDVIIGDADGVVVVPGFEFESVVHAAQMRQSAEAEMLAKIRAGATTLELFNLPAATEE